MNMGQSKLIYLKAVDTRQVRVARDALGQVCWVPCATQRAHHLVCQPDAGLRHVLVGDRTLAHHTCPRVEWHSTLAVHTGTHLQQTPS